MDRLEELPEKNDTVKTAEEEGVIADYFGDASSNNTTTHKIEWKRAAIASGIFLLLANPLIDSLMCKIPYCGGGIGSTLVKTLLFFIIFVVIQYFQK